MFVMGFLPDCTLLHKLCPAVRTVWAPSHLFDTLMSHQYFDKLNVSEVQEGEWMPTDGDDFEARTPREWVWIANPEHGEDAEEYERLVDEFMK